MKSNILNVLLTLVLEGVGGGGDVSGVELGEIVWVLHNLICCLDNTGGNGLNHKMNGSNIISHSDRCSNEKDNGMGLVLDQNQPISTVISSTSPTTCLDSSSQSPIRTDGLNCNLSTLQKSISMGWFAPLLSFFSIQNNDLTIPILDIITAVIQSGIFEPKAIVKEGGNQQGVVKKTKQQRNGQKMDQMTTTTHKDKPTPSQSPSPSSSTSQSTPSTFITSDENINQHNIVDQQALYNLHRAIFDTIRPLLNSTHSTITTKAKSILLTRRPRSTGSMRQ